jgi:hypothetical protein
LATCLARMRGVPWIAVVHRVHPQTPGLGASASTRPRDLGGKSLCTWETVCRFVMALNRTGGPRQVDPEVEGRVG